VLRRLFSVTVEEYGAKLVHWRNLVIAMQDAGLLAIQCVSSAVIFASQEGGIVFHKPHSDLKGVRKRPLYMTDSAAAQRAQGSAQVSWPLLRSKEIYGNWSYQDSDVRLPVFL
jgi:hypothetical protein